MPINVKSSQHFLFFQMKSSLVNVSDLSEFVACIIPYNVSSSGELTRASFILLHDGLAFSGVARERGVHFTGAPLTVGRVAIFIACEQALLFRRVKRVSIRLPK